MKYHLYSDPGHAWLKVKVSELIQLGVYETISPYSYQRGEYAYLEEDSDMTKFLWAKLKLHPNRDKEEFRRRHQRFFQENVSVSHTNRSSRIRNYSNYNPH